MHTINTLLERLDPGFVSTVKDLRATILKRKKGSLLSDNTCHIPGIAIHFNQDGEEHTDTKSLHSGWDVSLSIHFYKVHGYLIKLGHHCVWELQELPLPSGDSQCQSGF
jgi:hypothetical protein